MKEGERERGEKNELLKWLWLKSQVTFPPSAIGGNFESPFTLVAAAAAVAAVAAFDVVAAVAAAATVAAIDVVAAVAAVVVVYRIPKILCCNT